MLGPRAREAFLLRLSMSGPWSLEVSDGAPLTVVTQRSGQSWFTIPGTAPVLLEAGFALVITTPEPYILADQPGTVPQIRIGPGQLCSGDAGRDLSQELGAGVRAWGNDPDGGDRLLVGTYHRPIDVGEALAGSLPRFALLPVPDPAVVDMLERGTRSSDYAQNTVLDRMLDLYLTTLLRAWVEGSSTEAGRGPGTPGLAASDPVASDPALADVISQVRRHPGRPWTLAALASEAGLSTAALVRRMKQETGLAPMAFVSQVRISATLRLLESSDLTLDAIARKVGYASAFSLSAAFKRSQGLSPSAHRARMDLPAPGGAHPSG